MNPAFIAAAIVMTLMTWFAIDSGRLNHTEAKAQPPAPAFGCRAPAVEGDLAIITVTVRAGELVAECQYATARPSKPRKGG